MNVFLGVGVGAVSAALLKFGVAPSGLAASGVALFDSVAFASASGADCGAAVSFVVFVSERSLAA